MAIDTNTTVKNFCPILETQLVEIQLAFPIPDFAHVLREIETRLCYPKDGLFDELFKTINQHTGMFGLIKSTMIYDAIFVTIDCRAEPFDIKELKTLVAKACRCFWNSKDIFNAKEVKSITEKAR